VRPGIVSLMTWPNTRLVSAGLVGFHCPLLFSIDFTATNFCNDPNPHIQTDFFFGRETSLRADSPGPRPHRLGGGTCASAFGLWISVVALYAELGF